MYVILVVPELIANAAGFSRARMGPGTKAVNAPLLLLSLKPETSYEVALPVNTNFPLGSTATDEGAVPAFTGEPETAVSAPVVELIVNSETLFDPELDT